MSVKVSRRNECIYVASTYQRNKRLCCSQKQILEGLTLITTIVEGIFAVSFSVPA